MSPASYSASFRSGFKAPVRDLRNIGGRLNLEIINQSGNSRPGPAISQYRQSVSTGEQYQTLPFVRPGGDILLRLDGWPKVQRVLQAIDAVEALGIDAADASTDYWRHVHNRLTVGDEPRPYSTTQHMAWLMRQRVTR
ncbi:MAG TPA: DUF2840 domain-containing protein [Stellaceae bacterium]|nr:DUF2840 domain-containing protein [Stellaceae bacterium]